MIDWTRVRDLRDEIGDDSFADVVDLFLVETSAVVARLRDYPEPASLEADLHFLKGCVLNLGFSKVSALCQQGESMAAKGDAAQVDLAAIINAYDQTADAFKHAMSQQFSAR
ncbi:MAG: Hpt domain-containing protein [Rhodobacterales bacterium]